MKLNRDVLDAYLDGGLAVGEVGEVERALRGDAAAAGLLSQMRKERAMRGAALASYGPSEAEAGRAAAGWMMAFAEETMAPLPLARIGWGVWSRRMGAVAAGLLVVAGAFWMGRVSAVGGGAEKKSYVVMASDGVNKEFASADEAHRFLNEEATKQAESEALASADSGPGVF